MDTKRQAESRAAMYRDKGYNARVVNWAGGSGIYLSAQRSYNKTKSEAREKWMAEIAENDYRAGAFDVGRSFSINAKAGDAIETATSSMKGPFPFLVTDTGPIPFIDLNYLHEEVGSISDLDDAIIEVKQDYGVIPLHHAAPENHMSLVQNSLQEEMMREAHGPSMHGLPGWGSGVIPDMSGTKMLDFDYSKPMPRKRYRVVLEFEQPDGSGERPSYAFATETAAATFAGKLQELITENGYYREGGTLRHRDMPGSVMNTDVWVIPADKIGIAIVEETASFVEEQQDNARSTKRAETHGIRPFRMQGSGRMDPIEQGPTAKEIQRRIEEEERKRQKSKPKWQGKKSPQRKRRR